MGYLKEDLSSEDKQDLLALIEDHGQGLLPLVVPPCVAAHRLKHPLYRHLIPDWVPRSFEVLSTENKPKAKGPPVA